MDGQSLNITEQRINQLRELFPDVFSDGKIDFNRLKDTLGENILFTGEKYELSWPGKAEARREVQKQTTATLVPDHEGSINFDTAQNVFIEGENLEVLRVLQKSYFGKVKLIYIDPPYNTGNDSFVYPDDFAERQDDYMKRTGQKDEKGYLNKQDLWKKNSKENGQFHSVWLSMMYPRLYLSRNLMREDGVVFISIDDTEVANLRLLMNEVFGEENFIASFIWKSRQNKDNRTITGVSNDHEYILCYAKNNSERSIKGSARKLEQYSNPDNDVRGNWVSSNMVGLKDESQRPNLHYDLINPNTNINYGRPKMGWRYDPKTMARLIKENRIIWPENPEGRPRRKVFLSEVSETLPGYSSIIGEGIFTRDGSKEILELFDNRFFDFPKPSYLIRDLINQVCDESDIILDFFAGSASTAQAVLEINAEEGGNLQFILVQMPEPLEQNSEAWKAGYRNIADIGKARIQKVIQRIREQTNEKAKTPALFDTSRNILGQVLGFQSYRLQYSNFNVWRNDLEGTQAILDQLEMFQEPLSKYNGKHSTLLTELILKAGFPLTVQVTEKEIDDCMIFEIDNGRMWLALDNINDTVFQAAAESRPTVFVTLNRLFVGQNADEIMANAHLQLKDAGIDFKII